jgi:hypothetical protein
MRRATTYPYNFVFLFEVVSMPYAGQRGTLDELSARTGADLIVPSVKVGICHATGELLEYQAQHATGCWTTPQSAIHDLADVVQSLLYRCVAR